MQEPSGNGKRGRDGGLTLSRYIGGDQRLTGNR
jgi:hypothetical protein